VSTAPQAVTPAYSTSADPAVTASPVAVATTAAPPAPAGGIISTPDEIMSAQQHLKFMGYDVPQANGILDLKTKIAVMQFQESAGKPTTGQLTYEELQMLFQKVAAQAKPQ
jgi:peptidoglycan hydrolase-like protein with peptidoglycan-binding domain